MYQYNVEFTGSLRMYSKTESELSIQDKMAGVNEKQNLDPMQKNTGCMSQRTRLEKILGFSLFCFFLCIIGLVVAVIFKDGSDSLSSVENANNYQRASLFYNHHPRWINRPVFNQPNVQQKICVTKGCVEAAANILSKIDTSVDPCDDFYQFACGNYIKNSIIPDDKGQFSEFSQMNDKLTEQVRLLLETPDNDNKAPYQLARNAYRACMDKPRIESLGVTPLLDTLSQLGLGTWPAPLQSDTWPSSAESVTWYDIMYRLRDMGLTSDILINFSVSTDLRNSSRHMMDLDQPELGLAREFLVAGEEDPVVQNYKNFMIEVFVLLGVDPDIAIDSVQKILTFEMKLANITMPREMRRDPNHQYNPMPISQLSTLDPDTPWLQYLSTILGQDNGHLTPDDIIVVNTPSYITNLRLLLQGTDIETQVNYIIWRIAAASLSYLNERAEDVAFKFSAQLSGQTQKPPRWQKCSMEVTQAMGPLVGSLYVDTFFSELSKSAAVEMVDEIRARFQLTLDQVDWMDDETRDRAKEKAEAMVEYIGYPQELKDMDKLTELYSGLSLSPDSYIGNGLNLSRYHMNFAFSKLRQAVDKNDWVRHGNPAMINAFYSPIENSIQFPAGILQGVFFNSERPRYLNYGAIGWVIGHEIIHGFDDQGRQFDKDGNLVNWWDQQTAISYLNKAQCMVQQYGSYKYPELGNIGVNGINTLGENIADNGGIKTSYQAYKSWVSHSGPEPMLPGLSFTPEQLFWISGANVWCAKHRPGDLRMNVMLGTHTPANFRIKGTYSNMEDFAKDFQCPVGSKMNPAPHHKCKVW